MNRKKLRLIVFMLACLLITSVILLGCNNDEEVSVAKEYTYTKESITYSEEFGEYGFLADVEVTETENAKYCFDIKISNNDRGVCIDATEAILNRVGDVKAKLEIYVFTKTKFDNTNVLGNRLYTTLRDWDSVEYTADVLIASYGNFSHYGLAYGYASFLKDREEHNFLFPSVTEVCDLNLLCFNTNFVSSEDVSAIKSISADFVRNYIEQNSENEFLHFLSESDTTEGMENVKLALTEYYAEHGINYAPSILRYGYGGISFEYIVDSDLGDFYITPDWVEKNLESFYNPLIHDNFLHENYSEAKLFFETNIKQMRQYQDFFNLPSGYDNTLRVLIKNIGGVTASSYYNANTHIIYLTDVVSLMHEYIHSLTMRRHVYANEGWKSEGFATYYSLEFNYYSEVFLNYDYNHLSNTAETECIMEFLEKIGRPIDVKNDIHEIEDIIVYSRSFGSPNDSVYKAGSSFIGYLVKQYGDEVIINWLYGDFEPLPKTYEELVAEWCEYINKNYSEYSKYTK